MLPLLLLIAVAHAVVAHATAARPHIMLIILDDIGRTDTGIYGKSNVPMPHIVSLANRGAVLENFYTQPVCSPTRSSLMTGRYPFRLGMQHLTTQLPAAEAAIPFENPTLAELLRDAGYDTHMVGKWHCGYATWKHTPFYRGFNGSVLSYFQGQIDYRTHVTGLLPEAQDGLDLWDKNKPLWSAAGKYSLDLYDERITKIFNDYSGKRVTAEQRAAHPLFVYLAHQTVHIPLQPKKDEVERCGHITHKVRNVYCSMLVELDDSIGSMVEQLKQHQLWDNTLVLLLTDNGGMVNFDPKYDGSAPDFGPSQGSNYPLRGSKGTLFDGGVRSLGFVSGGLYPKELAGQRFTGLAHVVDLSATVLAAAGLYTVNREKLGLDGTDLWPQLLKQGDQRPRTEVPINIIYGGQAYSAVRFGKYKVIVRDIMIPEAASWFDENGDFLEENGDVSDLTLLFDLEKDVEERKNLASEYPDLVRHGLRLIKSYVDGGDYFEPQGTSGSSGYVDPSDPSALFKHHPEASPLLHGGTWSPFMSEKQWRKNFAKERAAVRKARKDEAAKA